MLKLTLLFKNSILNYKKIDIKQAFKISFENRILSVMRFRGVEYFVS